MTILEKLHKYLTENHTLETKGKQYLKVDGEEVRKTLIDYFPSDSETAKKYALEDLGFSSQSKRDELGVEVFKLCLQTLKTQKREAISEAASYIDLEQTSLNFKNFYICSDVAKNTWGDADKFLIDKTTKEIVKDIHYSHLKDSLSLPKEEKLQFIKKAERKCKLVYNPHLNKKIELEKSSAGSMYVYNLFAIPDWMYKEDPGNNAPPEIFSEFMEDVFQNEKCRDWVYFWIYNSIYDRNESYLVLHGVPGAGKNVLFGILTELQGKENVRKAPTSLIDTQFNGALQFNRLMLWDELDYRIDKRKEKLKDIINPSTNIERKGVDADNYTELYNSHIITNNNLVNNKLVHDDRRFFCADMSTVDLKKHPNWGPDKINQLIEESKTLNFKCQLGYWLKRKYEDHTSYNKFFPPKTKTFYKAVYASLTEWQKFLLESLYECEGVEDELAASSLRKKFKESNTSLTFPTARDTFEGFFKSYRHGKNEIVVGETLKEGGKLFFRPTEELLELDELWYL